MPITTTTPVVNNVQRVLAHVVSDAEMPLALAAIDSEAEARDLNRNLILGMSIEDAIADVVGRRKAEDEAPVARKISKAAACTLVTLTEVLCRILSPTLDAIELQWALCYLTTPAEAYALLSNLEHGMAFAHAIAWSRADHIPSLDELLAIAYDAAARGDVEVASHAMDEAYVAAGHKDEAEVEAYHEIVVEMLGELAASQKAAAQPTAADLPRF